MEKFVIGVVGVFAGLVTTVVGFGGGLVLITGLSLWIDPLVAMAIASFALVFGNGHRLLLFWGSFDRALGRRWLAWVLLGSALGATTAVWVPTIVLRVAIVAVSGALVLARLRKREGRPAPIAMALVPAAAGTGLVGGGSGGAGLIAGPALLASGVEGSGFVAMMSATGVAVSLGRLLGYGGQGVLGASLAAPAAIAAASIAAGNLLGRRLRGALGRARLARLERALPWLCLALALAGLAR